MAEKKRTPIARKLRRQSTDVERRLWSHLRSRQLEGAKFLRQFPIGTHVADFVCRAAHLVVEVDGGHHSEAVDARRTEAIQSFGYRVIRFWNNDVLENTAGVIEAIRQELLLAFDRADDSPHPDPLPAGERGIS